MSVDAEEETNEYNHFDVIHMHLGVDTPSLGDLNTSMSWGGEAIYDWSPEGRKAMILRFRETEERHQRDTAMHEFGHSLGLGDAYSSAVMGPGVDYNAFNDAQDTVMDYQFDKRPSNNDIEMVILAFSTGNRQNFQKQFSSTRISDALGKGN